MCAALGFGFLCLARVGARTQANTRHCGFWGSMCTVGTIHIHECHHHHRAMRHRTHFFPRRESHMRAFHTFAGSGYWILHISTIDAYIFFFFSFQLSLASSFERWSAARMRQKYSTCALMMPESHSKCDDCRQTNYDWVNINKLNRVHDIVLHGAVEAVCCV